MKYATMTKKNQKSLNDYSHLTNTPAAAEAGVYNPTILIPYYRSTRQGLCDNALSKILNLPLTIIGNMRRSLLDERKIVLVGKVRWRPDNILVDAYKENTT